MSSLRFPTIETKKSLLEEEDYNFVNKDNKRKKTSMGNPLELIDDLKRKVDEQKKQIENRNMTIHGLQRNFESLSGIVKTEKTQSAALRAELQHLKLNSQTGDRRAADFHEKSLLLEKECKNLKDELKVSKRVHADCGQYVTLSEEYKKQISQLEDLNQKLLGKLQQREMDSNMLEGQLGQYKGVEKDKRLLNERIVDLEDELKKMTDANNGLNYGKVTADEELGRLRNEVGVRDRKIEELKMRLKDQQKQNQRVQFDAQFLKKEVARLTEKVEQNESMMQNKDMFGKIKQEQEEKAKEEYRRLLCEFSELKEQHRTTVSESEEKTKMVDFAHLEIEQLRKEKQQIAGEFQLKEEAYQKETAKLMKSIQELHQQLDLSTGESSTLSKELQEQQERNQNSSSKMGSLHDNIDEMNRKMQEHQQTYGHYLQQIARNEPDVVITNKREMQLMENSSSSTVAKLNEDIAQFVIRVAELESNGNCQGSNIENMRRYIKTLEEEVSSKSEELLEKGRALRTFQEEEDQLNRMISNQRLVSERLKKESEEQILQRMQELENEKLRSQKDIGEERRRLEEQLSSQKLKSEQKIRQERDNADRYSKMLGEYKDEEEKLKEMMSKQQSELSSLSQQKEEEIKRQIREREEELEKEKNNNKMLWSDNKKLKDLELKLKEESKSLLDEQEREKRNQIERLKGELENKYKAEMSSAKNEASSSNELKKILLERNSQFKELTENHNKVKSESEFYKNRNKELEALAGRLEKQFKDQTVDLERENKANKQVIEVLDHKLKESEGSLAEGEKKQRRQLKYLYDEIEDMKKAAKGQRVEEKIMLVNKSLVDLQTSLTTLMNTMSCNYCVEVVRECVRLECGHIYCRKCKGGYQPNCGECKKKGAALPDKMIDDSVSKAQYMNILITTIKDDLSKISK